MTKPFLVLDVMKKQRHLKNNTQVLGSQVHIKQNRKERGSSTPLCAVAQHCNQHDGHSSDGDEAFDVRRASGQESHMHTLQQRHVGTALVSVHSL